MLAKILVGVVAAVAVTGAGVYYATHGCPFSQCCQQDTPAVSPSDATTACSAETETSCCSLKAITVSEGSSCCAAKATSADGLGACVGGMAVTTAAPTAKKGHACCDE